MDAKGRAELGGVMMRGSGLAPTLDGADLTSLQVGRYCWLGHCAPLGLWRSRSCGRRVLWRSRSLPSSGWVG